MELCSQSRSWVGSDLDERVGGVVAKVGGRTASDQGSGQ